MSWFDKVFGMLFLAGFWLLGRYHVAKLEKLRDQFKADNDDYLRRLEERDASDG